MQEECRGETAPSAASISSKHRQLSRRASEHYSASPMSCASESRRYPTIGRWWVAFESMGLVAACKHCQGAAIIGLLHYSLLPRASMEQCNKELVWSFSKVVIFHGRIAQQSSCPHVHAMSTDTDDCGAEPPALAKLVAILNPKLADAYDFTLATLSPGLDSGVTSDDWKWLRRQLNRGRS